MRRHIIYTPKDIITYLSSKLDKYYSTLIFYKMNQVQKVTVVTGFVLAMVLSVVSVSTFVNEVSASSKVIIEPPNEPPGKRIICPPSSPNAGNPPPCGGQEMRKPPPDE